MKICQLFRFITTSQLSLDCHTITTVTWLYKYYLHLPITFLLKRKKIALLHRGSDIYLLKGDPKVEIIIPNSPLIPLIQGIKLLLMAADIESVGYKCINLPIEICSRGHISTRNRSQITQLFYQFNIRKFQKILRTCSKLSLLASYSIFNSRSEQNWSRPSYLKPWYMLFIVVMLYYVRGVLLLYPPYVNPKLPCYSPAFLKLNKFLGYSLNLFALYFVSMNKAV